ncbi:MAG: hypothetical protein IIY74_01995, partial [Firmicutes bacterium]|nr:hypothetical protein [Bacillota bacterium]
MNDKSFGPAGLEVPAGMNMPFGGPAGACSSELFDLKRSLERLIGSQKELLSRCEAVAASVPGRLSERK